MKRTWAGLLLATSTAFAQNPFRNDPLAPEAGRGIFRIYCGPCHGIKAEGGRGPDLTRGTYSAGDRDEDLHRVIIEGAADTEMPSFKVSLGDDNAWRLVSFIRSVARKEVEPVTGNPASGDKLFWGKGGCGACHRVGQKGGRMAPDLTTVGRIRSLKYLRESVVAPNADITPGFATISVVTRDGKKITGVQRGFDNFSAQLMDMQEDFHSYMKSDVKEATRSFNSLMPGTYQKSFTAAELNDLIAYLYGLGREGKK